MAYYAAYGILCRIWHSMAGLGRTAQCLGCVAGRRGQWKASIIRWLMPAIGDWAVCDYGRGTLLAFGSTVVA